MYHFINDNFHTDIATVPPSYKMKHFHEHNRWELMFIYSGSCTLYVGDEIYMLNPGGLALIPPDMAHMTTYLAGSDHTRYVLYFNNDDLKWIADDSSLDIESIFHKHPVVHIPERRLDYISSIIQKISYEHNGVDSLSLSFVHSYFHELILFILRCQMYEDNVITKMDTGNELIQKVIEYIMEVIMADFILLDEDFSDFPIGEFPYDKNHSAMGEYHFIHYPGYYGKWYDPVCNHVYNGQGASWIISEYNGKHFMEQMRIRNDKPHRTFPMLTSGDRFWRDYTITASVRMFTTKWGNAGIGFCCQNSANLLVLVFEEHELRLEYRHKEEVTVLDSVPFDYNCDDTYVLKAEIKGSHVICSVNDKVYFDLDSEYARQGGKVAITATIPTQFGFVNVTTSESTAASIDAARNAYKAECENAQAHYPKMKLLKKIDLKGCGTGRQLRFGHLLGNGEYQMVMAQCQKRVNRDAYGTISCLTAFDLDGNILWQHGEPTDNHDIGTISADMPMQIYDIDGDGFDEVITAKNFEVLILDGRTGEVKKRAKTPFSTPEEDGTIIGVPDKIYAFDRINPDGMRICNFRGLEKPRDILIKDRYCRVYALNDDLEVMWHFQSDKNTGHFPFAIDINGDGHDELLVGYNMLDCHGNKMWTMPVNEDHIDEIVPGRFESGPHKGTKFFACVAGKEGFLISDFNGKLLKKDGIGHAQRVSLANYLPNRPGYEMVVVNFWGHQGIIYFYDSEGNQLWEMENELNGNLLTPVNWTGDGQDFILLNADIERGGMIDGNGIQVVKFPDDGHPTMCAEAVNLYGDARDEIVTWDYDSMYIYTQDDAPKDDVYAPFKYPDYNASNYRGEYSYREKWW